MSASGGFGIPGSDAFTAFWNDFWNKFGSAGSPPPPQSEVFEKSRKAFFDAMAQSCEEFMRSEAFLRGMKQSMDHAMGWQQMMNEYLRKGVAAAQMPTREDADHVAILVRGLEERLIDRIEALEQRLSGVESAPKSKPASKRPETRKPARARRSTKN